MIEQILIYFVAIMYSGQVVLLCNTSLVTLNNIPINGSVRSTLHFSVHSRSDLEGSNTSARYSLDSKLSMKVQQAVLKI